MTAAPFIGSYSDAPRLGAIGASITLQNGALSSFDLSSLGFLTWAMYLSNSRLKYAGHWGAGGIKADVVRDQGMAYLLSLPGQRPQYIIIDANTNNMSSAPDLASAKTCIPQIVAQIKNVSSIPICVTVPPRDTGTATEYQNISDFNSWLARYCEINSITLVDWHTLLVDPLTAGWIAGLKAAGDGLHPNNLAAKIMGQAIVDAIPPKPFWTPKLRSSTTDATDKVVDGCFLGATGSGAAGLSNAWSPLAASTPTYSIVADAAIKGSWQRFSQAGSGLGWIVSGVGMTVVPGNRMRWSGRIKINSLAASAVCNFSPVIAAGGTEFGTEKNQLTFQTGDTVSGIYELDFTIPAGLTSILLSCKINGGAGDVQFAQQSLVDLTAIGATP